MHIPTMRWHRLAGSLVLLLFTAGCYQAMGSDIQATDAAQQAPTFTPFPTNTPPPTVPIETATPFPTQQITINVTIDAQTLLTPGALPFDDTTPVAQLPTLDPIYQTVTAIYEGQQGQPPAEVVPAETLEPIAITATFIVQRATLTAAAPLTQEAIALGTVMAPTPAAPGAEAGVAETPLAGNDCIHEVRATDRNLYRISLSYGLTVQEIAQYNNLVNPDRIYVGDRLVIPGCGNTGARPLPTSTPSEGAPPAAQDASGLNATPVPQAAGPRVHVVRQGDTLFQIALTYGANVHEIAAMNGIADINRIYIGQQLTIP